MQSRGMPLAEADKLELGRAKHQLSDLSFRSWRQVSPICYGEPYKPADRTTSVALLDTGCQVCIRLECMLPACGKWLLLSLVGRSGTICAVCVLYHKSYVILVLLLSATDTATHLLLAHASFAQPAPLVALHSRRFGPRG